MRTVWTPLWVALALSAAGCGDDGPSSNPPQDSSLLPDTSGDAGPNCLSEDVCGDGIDNDCDGTADEDCGGIGTFVSSEIGDDANPGTLAEPVKTIGKGIANAVSLGGARSVIIGEGAYAEKLTLVEGVTLLGGHSCTAQACTFARDITAYTSAIENTDFEGVLAGPTITQATLLSGLTIRGLAGAPSSAAGSAAVSCAGGCPTLRGNKLVGGAVTGGGDGTNRSIGLALGLTADPAGVLVESNEIAGGPGLESYGITIENAQASGATRVNLVGNVIRSGTARRSIAVLASRAAAGSVLANNDIVSGSSAMGASHGVVVTSPLLVEANRINLDRTETGICTQATAWCTGLVVEGATVTIQNNVIFAPRGFRTAGLLLAEISAPAGTVIAANNHVSGGGSTTSFGGSQRSQSTAVLLAIGGAPLEFTGAVGALRNNILDGGFNQDRFGVREEPSNNRAIHPTALVANAFQFRNQQGRDDTLYRFAPSGNGFDLLTIASMEAVVLDPVSDNIDDGCELDPTFHHVAGSACIDAGSATDAPGEDFEGDVRPAGEGYDIGPDED